MQPNFLQPSERPVITSRRHWGSAILPTLALAVIGGGGAYGLTRLPSSYAIYAAYAWISLATVGWFILLRRVVTSRYLITHERLYSHWGRFLFHVTQTTFDKITDVHLSQGPLGRWFGYASMRVETAGSGVVLSGLTHPFEFKRHMESERSAFLTRLVSEGAPAASAVSPRPVGMGRTKWQGKPHPLSILGAFLSAGAAIIVSLTLLGASVGDIRFLLGTLLLWFIAILIVARGVIVLTCTRFFVNENGVIITSGWLARRRVETTYSKVTDVQINQDILGRIFSFGVIRINTAGSASAPVVFMGVRDPESVKATIDAARGAA